jgi:hypothetical protein
MSLLPYDESYSFRSFLVPYQIFSPLGVLRTAL